MYKEREAARDENGMLDKGQWRWQAKVGVTTREMFELRSNDFKKRRWRFTASKPPITELLGLQYMEFTKILEATFKQWRLACVLRHRSRILRRIMLHEKYKRCQVSRRFCSTQCRTSETNPRSIWKLVKHLS